MSAAGDNLTETAAENDAVSNDKQNEPKEQTQQPQQEKKAEKGNKKEEGVTTKSTPKEEREPKPDPKDKKQQKGGTDEDQPGQDGETKADLTLMAFYLRIGDHSILGDGAVVPVAQLLPDEVEQNFRTRVYRDPTTAVRNGVQQLRISHSLYTADDYILHFSDFIYKIILP
eukprot:TRINITY_DN2019_c0_g1_i1.p1 TRINITY_DN2019_c0_g1~~TRINITY_DN2019_c0_g1_i1.p1  ORF type:complete len:171 (+),score=31.91 TRINITY_DN2019_c0_g1_i1:136-648(+)